MLKKIVLFSLALTVLNSCGARRIYTSASYGSLKSYTEKPINNGEKETATYISGSFSNPKHPQHNEDADKVTAGNFSIYRATTDKRLNYYYGLGGGFGRYQFKSDLTDSDNSTRYIDKNDALNFYNINLKTGINFTKTWERFEYSIIGLEFIYVNEFGPYIDKLNDLPEISDVVVLGKKSIFAFNLNTEITFRINKNNNIGYGIFFGSVLFLDRQETQNKSASYNGFILKYNYKDFTISLMNEHSAGSINSTQFGLTYKLFSKSKVIEE
ncbi:hypothetical protein FORMB_07850 [Formosa sp. Hel1_33_131]|uniref:hypothetical protein n=1 Tax=Formosa sp. Hel1_33_131 TaxID=1336794 RepID=UPI00084E2D99|nr:hypothetical protein [Formosa sp. Hel1_33_131]AOR27837.1 hypothetical protein FORMB_07850 [Formosa sp. Hel1_33_131]